MSEHLRPMYKLLEKQLYKIERLFDGVDGFEGRRVTLLVRTPNLLDGGILMGNDDIEEIVREVQRLGRKPACYGPPEAAPASEETT